MTEPNKENLRLWVEALRSGEYTQGRKVLAQLDPDTPRVRYCCLGVACETAGAVGRVDLVMGVRWNYATGGPIRTYDGEGHVLPEAVRLWLGLSDNDPLLRLPGEADQRSASRLNDDIQASFNTIADAIEYTFYLR